MSFSTPGLGVNRHISDNGFALYPHSLSQQSALSASADHVRSPPPTPESEAEGESTDHEHVDIDLVESPWLSGRPSNPNSAMASSSASASSSSADATSKCASAKGAGSGKSKSFTASVKKLFSSSSDRERDKERQRLRQLSISSPTLIHSTSLAVQPPPNPLTRSASRSSSNTNRSRTRSQSPHGSVVSAAYPSPTSSASSADSPVAEQSPFALPPEGVPPVPAVDPTLRARAQSLPAPSRLPPELMAAAAIADASQHYMTSTLPDPSVLGMSWQSQSSLSTALGNASVVSLPNLPTSSSRSMQSPVVPPKSLAARRRRDSDMILHSKQKEEQDDWLPPTGVTKKMSLTPKVVADSSSSSSASATSSGSSKSLPPPPPLAPPRIPIWAQFQNHSSAPPGPLSPVSQAAFFSSSTDDYRSTPIASSTSSSAISSPASSTRGLISPPSIPIAQLPLKSPALSTRSLDSPAPQPQPNDLLTKAPVPTTDPQDLLRLESLITATVDSERRVLQHLRKQSLSGASSPSTPAPAELALAGTCASTPEQAPAPAVESDLDRRLAKMAEFERLISTTSPAVSSRSLHMSADPPTPSLSALSSTQFPGASAEGDQMVALAALRRVQMDKYPVPACELTSSASDSEWSDDDQVDTEVQQRVIARHPSLANIFAPLTAGSSTGEPLRDPRQAADEAAEAARLAAKSRGVKGWFADNRTKILGTLKTVLRDASGNAAARAGNDVSADAKQDLVQFARHVIRTTSESTLGESGGGKKRQSVKRRTVTKADVSSPIVEEGDEMDVINMYANGDEREWVRRRSSAKGKAREATRRAAESVVEADDELIDLVRQIEALMTVEGVGREE
ncbi:hypothetical protein BCR44DRAFT_1182354 [Catenaria anguillulae PL171]|uniref:Uncharacterized protein n=1 Tax=Catenaria anguillulae PL171 TaxID=765915 RepID=A0A1Y2HLW4_9FUNG|nr:hypothetical protein BCR44DRAFT_1182354 [Catenaria anguillulae PL171]